MTKSATLLALDIPWLVHRAYHGAQSSPEEARPRIVARTVLGQVFNYGMRVRATHLLAAVDGGACFRKQVWALYKASRISLIDPRTGVEADDVRKRKLLMSGKKFQRLPDPINDCEVFTVNALRMYGVPVIQRPEYEADDLLSSSANMPIHLAHPTHAALVKVYLCTKDKDIIQSLNPKASQWHPNPGTDTFTTVAYSDLSTRLSKYVHADAATWTPLQFRDYQILIGDPTDDVPPIVANAHARKIITKHGSLKDYFDTKEGKEFYFTHQEYLLRNRELVAMKTDLMNEVSLNDLRVKRISPLPQPLSKTSQQAYLDYLGFVDMASKPGLFTKRAVNKA